MTNEEFLNLCLQAETITFRESFGAFLLWMRVKGQSIPYYDVTTYEMKVRKYRKSIKVNGLEQVNNWGYYGIIPLCTGERKVTIDEVRNILTQSL